MKIPNLRTFEEYEHLRTMSHETQIELNELKLKIRDTMVLIDQHYKCNQYMIREYHREKIQKERYEELVMKILNHEKNVQKVLIIFGILISASARTFEKIYSKHQTSQ